MSLKCEPSSEPLPIFVTLGSGSNRFTLHAIDSLRSIHFPRHLPDKEQWSQSSGSNVIPRRARPGLAGLRPHGFWHAHTRRVGLLRTCSSRLTPTLAWEEEDVEVDRALAGKLVRFNEIFFQNSRECVPGRDTKTVRLNDSGTNSLTF